MTGSPPDSGPQIAVDPRFDRIQWRIERVAWAVMALVILGALLGLLGGGGPLGDGTASSGAAEARYSRVTRFHADERLEVTVPALDGEARLAVSQSFLGGMEVEGVHPEPDSVEAGADAVIYVFQIAEGEDSAEVAFTLRPQRIGFHSADIVAGGEPISFRQFTLP